MLCSEFLKMSKLKLQTGLVFEQEPEVQLFNDLAL